jgi:hypothetical protein
LQKAAINKIKPPKPYDEIRNVSSETTSLSSNADLNATGIRHRPSQTRDLLQLLLLHFNHFFLKRVCDS